MPDLAALILQCAIGVHPETVSAIIQHESGGNQYALNTQVRSYYPSQLDQAGRLLAVALQERRSTDIGLMQVNTQWLPKLKLPAEALFDPCTNIRVGTWILSTNYGQTWNKYKAEKPALLAALSLYNTGDESRGLRNGYVAKVTGAAGLPEGLSSTAEGDTTAPSIAVPVVHPRTAPTGFPGTGPKPSIPAPR